VIKPRIIPILLLQNNGLVKGIHFRNHKYVGDPINAVRIFNEKGADELFILDISAEKRGGIPNAKFIQSIADECYMPFGVGGGINNISEMRQLLKAGAEKVSINTAAIKNPVLIKEASEVFGSQSITVSIDVKKNWLGKYVVYSHSGSRNTGLDPLFWAKKVAFLGAGEILLNSIDRDGTGKGYDLELTKMIANAVDIPVIVCGGAGDHSHLLQAIEKGGASATAAGSMFVFYGPHRSVLIQYPDMLHHGFME
jgi:imidazole glycerol-phosphate synthase subunit HisF